MKSESGFSLAIASQPFWPKILITWGSVYISNSDIDRDCQNESWKYQRLKIYKIFDVVIECSLFKLFVSIWTENLTEDGPSFGFVAPAAVACVDGFAPTALQEIISWKDCQSMLLFMFFFSGRKMKNVFVTCIYVWAKQVLDIANDMPTSQPELPLHKILQRSQWLVGPI